MGVTQGLLGLIQCCLPLGSHDATSDEEERQPLLSQDGIYIVILHHGRIVEQGSHDKLLASKGRYASLWATKEPYQQNESLARYTDGSTSTENESVTEPPKTASPIKTPKQRHRREGSRLNPDAPEFTPGAAAAAKSQPSPFFNGVETPTPAQRTTPLPENIALPLSAAPVSRSEFRFPLASPRRRFESKSETKEESDGDESPRRVSAPSPSRAMWAAPREDGERGGGTSDVGEEPTSVKETPVTNRNAITTNDIKPASGTVMKASADQHHQQAHGQTTQASNASNTGQRGHSRPRGRFARGRGRRGGRSGNTRGSTEGSSGLPIPAKAH
ncbi:hypothetical protein ACHAQA_007072 [Verticillium albo-atrum]